MTQLGSLLLAASLVSGSLLAVAAHTKSPLPADKVPAPPTGIWAELQGRLIAERAHVGDSLLAKTTQAWHGKDCELPAGTILEGHVIEVSQRTAASNLNQVSVNFEGSCGEGKPLALLLVAILRPQDETTATKRMVDALPISIASHGRDVMTVANVASSDLGSSERISLPQEVKSGEVWGISHLNLSVGTGVSGSSVLSTPSRKLHLEFATNLVFSPRKQPLEVASDSPARVHPKLLETASVPTAKSVEPIDDTEICSPPSCSLALSDASLSDASQHALTSFSIAGLGYAPRLTRELTELDYDAAIAYLGSNELLFTFNPHRLVPRSAADHDDVARVIRAVLIDVNTKKVTHTVEWRVPDKGQYLWPVGEGHLLVHVGNKLRLYGAGLRLEHEMQLDGALSFLRVSPDGKWIVVGIVHERHSWKIHRQLEESTSMPPEEDVAVHVVDSSFRPLGENLRNSSSTPPVVTNVGEVRAIPSAHQRWLIQEVTWEQQTRKIATVISACEVRVVALRADLLFLNGCDRSVGNRWYRAVRMNGHTILNGEVGAFDLENPLLANPSSATFLMAITRAGGYMSDGAAFHGSDLIGQNISVYAEANGKRLFNLNIASPPPTRQTFALSPKGDRLAVLQANQISFYALPIIQTGFVPQP